MDLRNFQKNEMLNKPDSSQETGVSLSGMKVTTPTIGSAKKENPDPQSGKELSLEVANEKMDKSLLTEYRDFLKEKGIDDNYIFQVLDYLLTNNTFYWQFNLMNSIDIVFKVRSAYVNSLLVDKIEKEVPKTVAKFQDIVNTHNLAGTLHKYNDKVFNIEDPLEFSKALAFVNSLPFVIVQKLITELILFDRLMFVVSSEWAIENFTKPSSDEQEQTS